MNCRHCNAELNHIFVDLINCPPSNDMLKPDQLNDPETYYPLKIFTCQQCYLVQVDEMKKADAIFNSEYTYFSSFSSSWLAHAKRYVDMMKERFQFNSSSQVIEIASNDGYLLQYFKEYNIPVLGVDPTANTASVAMSKGIPMIIDFFGSELAREKLVGKGIKADLILGNNVLAHVPDINDFVKGVKIALKNTGVVTFEFPHLYRLVEEYQFDTIYHEHFSYLSFFVVKQIFESQGLEMFDVEELPTHGGSLRIFAKHKEDNSKSISPNVQAMLEKEKAAGMNSLEYYNGFQEKVDKIKYDFWNFLIEAKKQGKVTVGYGAAAKGNTLINYCGLKGNDLIRYVSDASPHKQNKLLPGSHIPVKSPQEITSTRPDYVIIFPWNLKTEIGEQLKSIREWGGKFVTFIPELNVF
ncbi:MAG TPA: class I SAM-dependent methyltransferase [Bacteroidales bacterium]|nr:class I SAM-dependent methyltransferase [Bacteroidales bacterium]